MDAFPTRPDYEYRRARRPTRRLGRRGGTSCADAQNDGTPWGLPRAAWPAPLATLLTGQERRTPSPCSRRVRTPDHSRLTPYLTRTPLYLAPMVLYLNPTLQGCYQVLKSCVLGYFSLGYQLLNPS